MGYNRHKFIMGNVTNSWKETSEDGTTRHSFQDEQGNTTVCSYNEKTSSDSTINYEIQKAQEELGRK